MTTKAGSALSWATVSPISIGFSPRAISAFDPAGRRRRPRSRAVARPGSEVTPRSRAPLVFGLRSALRRMSSPGPVRGTMSIKSTPRIFASCDVSQSSSFVIRPEARIAISQPEKCFNCTAAWVIATFQSAGDEFVAGKNLRLEQPFVRLEVFEIQPPVIAHPGGIDGVVFARGLAINHVFARADDGVAAGGATRAETLRFLQEPDAHLEAEIG